MATPQDTAHPQEARECPYCHKAVHDLATRCPHCGALIDPRYPASLLDESAYRYARMIVLHEIKDEVFNWARGRAKIIGGLLSAFFMLAAAFGIWGFLKLTTTTIINGQVEKTLGSRFDSIETHWTNLDSQLKGLKERQASAASQQSNYSARVNLNLTNLLREIEQFNQSRVKDAATIQDASRMQHQTTAELRGLIDRATSRIEARGPQVILKSPNSLINETATVFYQPADQEIRFRWDWIGANAQHGDGNPVVYSVKVGRWPDLQLTNAFETVTLFNSLKVKIKDVVAGFKLAPGPSQGEFVWQVSVKKGLHSPSIVRSPLGHFEVYPNVVARIRATGQLRVGISAEESPPFIMNAKQDRSRLDGYDIYVSRQLASRLPAALGWTGFGISTVYRQFDWFSLLNAPRNNEADLIISSITIKPERTELFAIRFSTNYYRTYQSLLYVADPTFTERVRQLRHGDKLPVEYKLTAVNGTTGERAANALTSDLNQVLVKDDVNDTVNSVLDGAAKAAIVDFPIAETEQKKHQAGRLVVFKLEGLGNEFNDDYGIAVRKGEGELLRAINGCLVELSRSVLNEKQREYGLP